MKIFQKINLKILWIINKYSSEIVTFYRSVSLNVMEHKHILFKILNFQISLFSLLVYMVFIFFENNGAYKIEHILKQRSVFSSLLYQIKPKPKIPAESGTSF